MAYDFYDVLFENVCIEYLEKVFETVADVVPLFFAHDYPIAKDSATMVFLCFFRNQVFFKHVDNLFGERDIVGKTK